MFSSWLVLSCAKFLHSSSVQALCFASSLKNPSNTSFNRDEQLRSSAWRSYHATQHVTAPVSAYVPLGSASSSRRIMTPQALNHSLGTFYDCLTVIVPTSLLPARARNTSLSQHQ